MLQFFKSLYLHQRMYLYLSLLAALFLVSNWVPILFSIGIFCALGLGLCVGFDVYLLYTAKEGLHALRILPDKLSNSDENTVALEINNHYGLGVYLKVIDELPFQFQKRDFMHQLYIPSQETAKVHYTVVPVERGEYVFGRLHVFTSTSLKMISRRYSFDQGRSVAVYPSYLQMKKYQFLAMSNRLTEFGLKKIRRIGHTLEFEQIKEYVAGDDVRTINWKATAKAGVLMTNQYQDEKSQPIYAIIDTGRVMKMPFNNLKLLDYAINATLAFSNIALLKNDKVGMFSFSKQIENWVPVSNKKSNLSLINEVLYNINTDYLDSDFGLLHATIKRKISQRSLLIMYTNFEYMGALERQLPYLKAIAKRHVLVVVFFENTALDQLTEAPVEDLQDMYTHTIAEKFIYEKRLMVKELKNNGIYAILTKPEELSMAVINNYLQFKAKGLI